MFLETSLSRHSFLKEIPLAATKNTKSKQEQKKAYVFLSIESAFDELSFPFCLSSPTDVKELILQTVVLVFR